VRKLLLSVERQARSSAAPGGPDPLFVLTASFSQSKRLARPQLLFEPVRPDGESRWHAAGTGEAARIDAHGARRIATVQAAGAALFERIIEYRAADCAEVPAPRLYGGFRFAPASESAACAAPWRDFADASFTLPRWLVLRRDGRAYLQLAVRREELIAHGSATH
jgi:hypothetical protein